MFGKVKLPLPITTYELEIDVVAPYNLPTNALFRYKLKDPVMSRVSTTSNGRSV